MSGRGFGRNHRIWQGRYCIVGRRSINRDVDCRFRSRAEGIKDGAALDGYRCFLVTRKVCYGWSIQTCPSVDVDGVDHIVGRFSSVMWIGGFVLASRCEKQTSVWGKRESSEERCVCLICIQGCILHSHTSHKIGIWRFLHWKDSRQWH